MKTKTAAIIYQSKRGTTQKYAAEISFALNKLGIETTVVSIQKFKIENMQGVDFLFLGCWTSGFFLFLQHPEKEWIAFAKSLPSGLKAKTALFTTYKIRTGSMFRNMETSLLGKFQTSFLKLKSRNGDLSETDKYLIAKFVE